MKMTFSQLVVETVTDSTEEMEEAFYKTHIDWQYSGKGPFIFYGRNGPPKFERGVTEILESKKVGLYFLETFMGVTKYIGLRTAPVCTITSHHNFFSPELSNFF